MTTPVTTRSVSAADLGDLAILFDTERTSRHCWCMAFCTTRRGFALGWYGGGNRRRFRSMATASPTPMGVLALLGGEPVGWGACGPRSRYAPATTHRESVLHTAAEDDVWLLPCVFVRRGHRGRGVSHALVGAAIELARDAGASALEARPLAESSQRGGDAFVGREQVFQELGFTCSGQLSPERVIMRLDLRGRGQQQHRPASP